MREGHALSQHHGMRPVFGNPGRRVGKLPGEGQKAGRDQRTEQVFVEPSQGTGRLRDVAGERPGGQVQPYAADYMTCIDEAKAHLRENARPALKKIPDVSDYDTIILAYPNYWGTMPMAAFTFLESADLSGKTIYPLCTNEGSGLGKSISDIKKYANVGEGLSLTGSGVKQAKPIIEKWLKNNGLI